MNLFWISFARQNINQNFYKGHKGRMTLKYSFEHLIRNKNMFIDNCSKKNEILLSDYQLLIYYYLHYGLNYFYFNTNACVYLFVCNIIQYTIKRILATFIFDRIF